MATTEARSVELLKSLAVETSTPPVAKLDAISHVNERVVFGSVPNVLVRQFAVVVLRTVLSAAGGIADAYHAPSPEYRGRAHARRPESVVL